MNNLLEVLIEQSEETKRLSLQYEQEHPKTIYTKLNDNYRIFISPITT